MSIRDEARQAAQEYAQRHVGGMQPVETIGDRVRAAFEAVRAEEREKADREPSDAEVRAFRKAWEQADAEGDTGNRVRRGLIAAQEVRNRG